VGVRPWPIEVNSASSAAKGAPRGLPILQSR
jgi:hypothetical protein